MQCFNYIPLHPNACYRLYYIALVNTTCYILRWTCYICIHDQYIGYLGNPDQVDDKASRVRICTDKQGHPACYPSLKDTYNYSHNNGDTGSAERDLW